MTRAIKRTCSLFVLALLLIIASGIFFTPGGQHLTRVYGPHLQSYYTGLTALAAPYSESAGTSASPLAADEAAQNTTLLSAAAAGPVMGKLLNETLKADLGRHAWFLFHTVLSRYPDTPTPGEREDLVQYVRYFTKLYPCGDCASHFQTVLERMPVQSSSRVAAAQWGCAVHNVVNARLGKQAYDCSGILEDYDCGCGP
ncbi:Putative uncharacterized protein [Taphrina deformans PYCC 5710]|uniref:Sulfhydryl oxidase n=1 Tax=Taphrina deformans (strain PYCC 5710 / ATCC 11124 / CBS 356.35 / IMI 108563 / JCM 9778 / NBRC 8474) TaxID=1097556 RepID=R4X718_TAPDE|nr:Putative uncharacterized protein [Taphrina deformans PYCC 5710]|eukprot:CCG80838.1 Putative uncharacterized protein [Taphrina deformans PYCC 5710]